MQVHVRTAPRRSDCRSWTVRCTYPIPAPSASRSRGTDAPETLAVADALLVATLPLDTNRIEEAEPLMRQSLDIFTFFGRQSGHEHPYFQRAHQSYQALLRAMESDEPG